MDTNKIISNLTGALGSVPAIVLSIGLIIIWLVSGPIFHFNDVWQLTINTVTTIITFCMVFVIQNSQNRDGRAMQTKLDAILVLLNETDKELLDIEDLTEKEIKLKDREIIDQ